MISFISFDAGASSTSPSRHILFLILCPAFLCDRTASSRRIWCASTEYISRNDLAPVSPARD